MQLTYRAIISIISIVYYAFALPTCIFIFCAQGPGNNSAYFWLSLFAIVRITGSGVQLYSEQHDLTPNSSYYSWVAILLNIGYSPLLLASTGMLGRVDGAVGKRMGCILAFIALPILLALALMIAGSIDPTSQAGPTFSANGEIKAAVALYMVCFLQLCYATAVILMRNYLAHIDDRKLALAVVISLPFMLVRVLYLVLFAFADQGNSEFFNVISGNETTQLCMQVIQEYIITFLYLLVGVTLAQKHRSRGDMAMAEESLKSGATSIKERGRVKRTLRYVPILYWFITLREVTKAQFAASQSQTI